VFRAKRHAGLRRVGTITGGRNFALVRSSRINGVVTSEASIPLADVEIRSATALAH
jgi:hypothetical protein